MLIHTTSPHFCLSIFYGSNSPFLISSTTFSTSSFRNLGPTSSSSKGSLVDSSNSASLSYNSSVGSISSICFLNPSHSASPAPLQLPHLVVFLVVHSSSIVFHYPVNSSCYNIPCRFPNFILLTVSVSSTSLLYMQMSKLVKFYFVPAFLVIVIRGVHPH